MPQKFIIENEVLKAGDVDLHNELSNNRSDVIGGGIWHIDEARQTLWLYGKSMEFGRCKLEDLRMVRRQGSCDPALLEFEWRFANVDSLERCYVEAVKV